VDEIQVISFNCWLNTIFTEMLPKLNFFIIFDKLNMVPPTTGKDVQ